MAIFKKFFRKRYPHESSGLKKFLIVVLVIVMSVTVLGGFWFLSQLGPKEVDYRQLATNTEIPEAIQAIQRESIELEAQFEEVLALRDASPEDLELLEQALEKQKAYMAAIPGLDSEGFQRQVGLEKRYQDLAAAALNRESLELEREAEVLAADKNFEEARAKYRESLAKQKQINEGYPLSAAVNVGRVTWLERQARYLTAQPLLQRSLAHEQEADQYLKAQDWESAEESLRQAMDLQDKLNREYRGTNQASVSRLEALRIKLVGIRSGQSFIEIEEVVKTADEQLAAGEQLEAAYLYQEAARLQRQLNQAFGDSPYASSEQVADYQRKAQTAESYELGLRIERNHDRMQGLLAERRTFEAAEVIVSLRQDIRQMAEAYPRSSMNNEELQVKIRYLNLVQSDFGFIQDRIYDGLLPIPGEPQWRMLRTEVSQALYSLIMGSNPSRNEGDRRPVDSVTWRDSQNFCERLSWILGKPVRLPTENEFREALGPLRYVVLEDHAWSVSDSDGQTQAVGTKKPFASGFHDLLGNVSEWLESVDRFENEDARHIGGHAQDRLESIFTVPVREAPRGERNRMTGFRVTVNVD